MIHIVYVRCLIGALLSGGPALALRGVHRVDHTKPLEMEQGL